MIDYQSTIDDLDEVTKQVKVSIGAPIVDERLQSRLGMIQKTAKLKGFRPGKAPLSLVRKMHGASERGRILEGIIGESLGHLIKENDLRVVGRPEISVGSQGLDGADFEYEAKVSLYPTPEVSFEEELKVSIPAVGDIEEAFEETIRNIRKSHGKPLPIADRDVVEKGDVVSIMFRPAEQEDGEKHAHKFVAGENEVPSALDEAVVGKKVGEAFEVELPGETPDVQQKLSIEVSEIAMLELPELNDDFAKETAYSVETLEELNAKIREMLEAQLTEVRNNAIDSEVIKALSDTNKFAVPEVMVMNELRSGLRIEGDDAETRFQMVWQTLPEERKTELKETAEARVRGAIILEIYAQNNNIEISSEEEDQELVKLLGNGGEAMLGQIPADSPARVMVRERVRNSKSLASIREKVIVEEVESEEKEEEGK